MMEETAEIGPLGWFSEDSFRVEPDPLWRQAFRAGWGEDDLIDLAGLAGWVVVRAWGSQGWPVGEWPNDLLFWRLRSSQRWCELTAYADGDVTAYRFPCRELLMTAIDRRVLAWWVDRGEPWATGYCPWSRVPRHLRGPYQGDTSAPGCL